MSQILLVDDDVELSGMLCDYLNQDGFQATAVHDGEAGVAEALAGRYAVVVLDVMMPRISGIEVLRRIRAASQVPVLMLTAKGDDMDRIVGLELGADDYVLKPFEPRELVARVRSIVRRREGNEAPARQIAEFSGWRFNLGNNRLISPNGEEHALSTAESELLKVFVNNPNRILQREKLMGTRDLAPTDRAIDVRISRLRRKLEPDADSPAFIKTVYGAGYLFLATVTWSGDNA